MGSFSSTCAVSGLPIEYGDKVRYLLLTQNPYTDSNIKCYMHDLWFPRCFPLMATYNDYGSVENVWGETLKQVVLDGLDIDLVEREWGRNTVHDVPVKAGMNFEQMLEAVWEARIRVSQKLDIFPEMKDPIFAGLRKKNFEAPEGVPTKERLEVLVKEAGAALFSKYGDKDSVIVTQDAWGQCTIRPGGWQDDGGTALLTRIQPLITQAGYANMITYGDDCVQHPAEMLVRPLPSVKNYGKPRKRDEDPPLTVAQCMIREDVWQQLLDVETEGWDGPGPQVSAYRKAAEARWERLTAKEVTKLDAIDMKLDQTRLNWVFTDDVVPFTIGLATAFRVAAKRAGDMSEDEKNYFLDSVAEMARVSSVLSTTRYQWRPTYSNGPQFGEWSTHERVLAGLHEVAADKAEKQAKEREGY